MALPRTRSRVLLVKLIVALACALALQFRYDAVLGVLLIPTILAGAHRYGRWEERTIAAALAVDLIVSHLVDLYSPETSRFGVVATDTAFLAITALVAILGRTWWPSWAAAFQTMIVTVHLAFVFMGAQVESRAYLIAVVIWTWLILLSLASGVLDRALETRTDPTRIKPPPGWTASIFVLAFGLCLWEWSILRGLKLPFLP